MGIFAKITYGDSFPFFPIRQRGQEERTSSRDHLGMNADQFTNEILRPRLLPFIRSFLRPVEDYKTVDDSHRAYTSRLAYSFANHRVSLAWTGHPIA